MKEADFENGFSTWVQHVNTEINLAKRNAEAARVAEIKANALAERIAKKLLEQNNFEFQNYIHPYELAQTQKVASNEIFNKVVNTRSKVLVKEVIIGDRAPTSEEFWKWHAQTQEELNNYYKALNSNKQMLDPLKYLQELEELHTTNVCNITHGE